MIPSPPTHLRRRRRRRKSLLRTLCSKSGNSVAVQVWVLAHLVTQFVPCFKTSHHSASKQFWMTV
jgi:hypothetical protein